MGKKISAALEYVRISNEDNDIFQQIFESIDEITDIISSELGSIIDPPFSSQVEVDTASNKNLATDVEFSVDDDAVRPQVGNLTEVFWPLYMQYYSGTISEITDSCQNVLTYDDGDTESLQINNEQWRFFSTISGSKIYSLPALESNEEQQLQKVFEYFGNKPFLRHHAQGFDSALLENAYNIKKLFLETVKLVP